MQKKNQNKKHSDSEEVSSVWSEWPQASRIHVGYAWLIALTAENGFKSFSLLCQRKKLPQLGICSACRRASVSTDTGMSTLAHFHF